MFDWHKLPREQKLSFLNEASAKTGYPNQVIEKDFWVTVVLKAIFETPWAEALVFKGGTSLSKAWNLIERFSEDIDLAIDRQALGFPSSEMTKAQIQKLRKASASFMEHEFMPALQQRILDNNIDSEQFDITIEPIETNDVDPRIIKLQYKAIEPGNEYVKDQVLIEIGARSLREPFAYREIQSILSAQFPGTSVQDPIFNIPTVLPERTFLEKAMLLHEEHCKAPEHRRHLRLSRHLYDLYRIKNSPHAANALADVTLFNTIVAHRKVFNAIRGISYENHTFQGIEFIPPAEVLTLWQQDYDQMGIMIFEDRPSFDEILAEMKGLLQMFREMADASAVKKAGIKEGSER